MGMSTSAGLEMASGPIRGHLEKIGSRWCKRAPSRSPWSSSRSSAPPTGFRQAERQRPGAAAGASRELFRALRELLD